jgi:phospholipid/cholesterol/gamma-HCH transport system substrate-binding protein
MTVESRSRLAGPIAAAVAAGAVVVLLALLLFGGGNPYTVHVEFTDASQLIKGDLVEVGGIPAGTIADLQLTPNGLADAVLHINESRFDPLHVGTTAAVGTVGLSGVANRFVDLHPGPDSAPAIPDGGTIGPTTTQSIVELDTLLNALTPAVRSDLQSLIRQGAKLFNGNTAAARRAFTYLNPALAQTAAISAQVSGDSAGLSSLLHAGGDVAQTLANHSSDLQAGVSSTAQALGEIASQRTALQDALTRAPSVLGQATATLAHLRVALPIVQPALRDAQPVAAPLARVLRTFVPTAQHANPVLAHLLHLLPALDTALNGLPALRSVALPALDATTPVVQQLLPIATGARPYAPDIVQGILHSLGAGAASDYDANGHFVRVAALGSLGSPLGQLLGSGLTTLTGNHTGLTAMCPGGAIGPAADKSNPFFADSSTCSPGSDQP